jgi:hypothetical protein
MMTHEDGLMPSLVMKYAFSWTILVSLLLNWERFTLYKRWMPLDSRFGHWYYPKTAAHQSGMFAPAQMNDRTFQVTYALLCAVLLFGWVEAALPIWMLWCAQIRTHGLLHNKADLVPWTLFVLAFSPASPCYHIELVLSLAYFSSGLMKVRRTGFSWAKGRNFSRLIAQCCLEYGGRPSVLQSFVMSSEVLCSIAQFSALFWELTFPMVLLCPSSALSSSGLNLSLAYIRLVYILVGASFHVGCWLLMKINFLYFWLPVYLVFIAPALAPLVSPILNSYTSGAAESAVYEGAVYEGVTGESDLFGGCIVCVFAVCVAMDVYGGEGHWPLSNFRLYCDTYGHLDCIEYPGLVLVSGTKDAQDTDSVTCSKGSSKGGSSKGGSSRARSQSRVRADGKQGSKKSGSKKGGSGGEGAVHVPLGLSQCSSSYTVRSAGSTYLKIAASTAVIAPTHPKVVAAGGCGGGGLGGTDNGTAEGLEMARFVHWTKGMLQIERSRQALGPSSGPSSSPGPLLELQFVMHKVRFVPGAAPVFSHHRLAAFPA